MDSQIGNRHSCSAQINKANLTVPMPWRPIREQDAGDRLLLAGKRRNLEETRWREGGPQPSQGVFSSSSTRTWRPCSPSQVAGGLIRIFKNLQPAVSQGTFSWGHVPSRAGPGELLDSLAAMGSEIRLVSFSLGEKMCIIGYKVTPRSAGNA